MTDKKPETGGENALCRRAWVILFIGLAVCPGLALVGALVLHRVWLTVLCLAAAVMLLIAFLTVAGQDAIPTRFGKEKGQKKKQ